MKHHTCLTIAIAWLASIVAAGATQIDWATTVTSPNSTANNALGAPDGITVVGAAGTDVYGGFGAGGASNLYTTSSLASFLNGIPASTLAQADFIAFESNGTPNITFESSTRTFSDGLNTFTITHTFGNTAAQDTPGVLALGNLSPGAYQTFFNTAGTLPSGDWAYILFDINGLSAVNTASAGFTVTLVSPGDFSVPRTPDCDALGRIPESVPESSTVTLVLIGVIILAAGAWRKMPARTARSAAQ